MIKYIRPRLALLIHPSLICMVWVGMVLAITMESVLKFKAPSISLQEGLDIGLQVFPALTKVELALNALLLFGAYLFNDKRVSTLFCVCFATVCLSNQALFLLPELISQAQSIIGGAPYKSNSEHAYYGILNVFKVLSLSYCAHAFLYNSLFSNTPNTHTSEDEQLIFLPDFSSQTKGDV